MKKILLLLLFAYTTNEVFAQFATPEMEHNFTKEEINDLEYITTFFIDQISHHQAKGLQDFEKYLYEMIDRSEIDLDYYIAFDIDYKDQQEMYNHISKSTFDKIWFVSDIESIKTGERHKELYIPSYVQIEEDSSTTSYFKLYKEYSKKSTFFNKRCEEWEASGAQPEGYMISNLIDFKYLFDLEDDNEKLYIAVYFLTLNDRKYRDPISKEKVILPDNQD